MVKYLLWVSYLSRRRRNLFPVRRESGTLTIREINNTHIKEGTVAKDDDETFLEAESTRKFNRSLKWEMILLIGAWALWMLSPHFLGAMNTGDWTKLFMPPAMQQYANIPEVAPPAAAPPAAAPTIAPTPEPEPACTGDCIVVDTTIQDVPGAPGFEPKVDPETGKIPTVAAGTQITRFLSYWDSANYPLSSQGCICVRIQAGDGSLGWVPVNALPAELQSKDVIIQRVTENGGGNAAPSQ
jgi:hypothetical protein